MVNIQNSDIVTFKTRAIRILHYLKGLQDDDLAGQDRLAKRITEVIKKDDFDKALHSLTADSGIKEVAEIIKDFMPECSVTIHRHEEAADTCNLTLDTNHLGRLYFYITEKNTNLMKPSELNKLDEQIKVVSLIVRRLEKAKAEVLFKGMACGVTITDDELTVLTHVNIKYKIVEHKK